MPPNPASGLQLEVLSSLNAIVAEWWELFRGCPDATPFQSPAWLLPWWKCFGTGEPLVVTMRREGVLCGLGLFYLHRKNGGEAPQLFLIGKAVSDYLDVLVAPTESRPLVAQCIFNCLFEHAGQWHSADLDRLRPSSPVLRVEPSPGLSVFSCQEGVCPELRLTGSTVEEFVPRKRTRANLRNRLRRARNSGSVEFVTANEQSCESLMNEFERLHSKRWTAAGGMFSDRNMTRFLKLAARALLSACMLRLNAMRLNGKTIAASLGMVHGRRAYLYNFGFDPAHAVIAPATQLIAFGMEQAAREGARVFDFLQGNEPYKFQTWGAEPRYTYRVRYFPATACASNG